MCSIQLSCVTPRLLKASDQTFSTLGPNCFATALYGAGLHNTFRGVSAREFQETLNSSCFEVKTPKFGDIGIYYVEGFSPTHAYTFISKDIVFEKPGVDYMGKTPTRFNTKASVDFIHVASPECRQWGDETCHSKQAFYRCSQINLNPVFQSTLTKINSIFNAMLTATSLSKADRGNIEPFYRLLFMKLKSVAETPLEKSIVHSLGLQIKFFEKIL